MCELLGMECNVPTDIVFSFTGSCCAAARRGHTPTAGGWRSTKASSRAASWNPRRRAPARWPSSSAAIRSRRCWRSRTSAARRAGARRWRTRTRSSACCGGATVRSRTTARCPTSSSAGCASEQPLGETDSEHAFCWMIERAARRVPGRLSQGSAPAVAGDRGHGPRAGRRGEVQLPARRRAAPVRPLRHQALLHHPQGAVRARDAARRRDADRFFGGDQPSAIASRSSRPSR